MKYVGELIPWKVTDISLCPYRKLWSYNPSIHFDGSLWRCTLRCVDVAMPGGVQIKSSRARPGVSLTKNAMVIFDPVSWKPLEIYKMHEHDDLPRASCVSVGYEDIRIFVTDKGGLQGIAASLHLRRDDRSRKQLAEQVLLSFDANYNIEAARPIRGEAWSGTPQKNWVPYDHCAEPRFLYSINEGTMFDDRGALHGSDVLVQASTRSRSRFEPDVRARARARERAKEADDALEHERRDRERKKRDRVDDPSGLQGLSTYEVIRGGTQLVRVGDEAWLGIGHAMAFVHRKKMYWHIWYLVDSRGKMKAASAPCKLAPEGIEFAAGMAIDGDRVVVSFGVDDMNAMLGETSLAAVLKKLQPIA